MTIDFSRGVFDPGGDKAGLLSGFYYTDATAEGGWNLDGEYGWLKFTFDGDSFTGTWGDHDSDTPRGEWNGVRAD